MNSIKDIIPQVIAPLSGGSAVCAQVGQWWQRHYGLGGKTRAVMYKDGVLSVNVDSAARRVRMIMEYDEYLKHVRSRFPDVVRIQFRVGKVI